MQVGFLLSINHMQVLILYLYRQILIAYLSASYCLFAHYMAIFDKFTKDLQIVSDFYLKVSKFCGSIYTR
ncbi:hypothetical protein D6D94_00750 [Moraxella catarrhalis]|uniref:Uncharacterized protein n=1 Tax=Moraxella catarrhalis TaxID=480 RepID=A0A3S9QCZ8_MORCA|nr:hypothetical protein DR90_854 [Moraxella catarrhalis]EGE10641.1 hypothetical protein E9G_06694 [Moraxella catarrhalis 7169]EGE16579.1 hypothetical protein E9Q_08379 [Moraxella catarrhalis BC1]OFN29454.1 hypothetical protein HMPREF2573_06775 [Moraxella sp. HMSC061H09]AVL49696.1 hypothetical protein CEP83_01035 [Moraxella catarrhalis]